MNLSIVIPVYNTPQEELLRCFDAIRMPAGISFEVLIIDDGSEYGVGEFCQEYTNSYENFHYIYQENQGVSAARNTGILHATGEYMMFVDADDELICNTLSKNIMAIGADIVFFDMDQLENQRRKKIQLFDSLSITPLRKKDYISAAYQNKVNTACAKMFRRCFLLENKIFFDRTMVVAEDAKFMLTAMIAANSIYYVPGSVYLYHHSFCNGDKRLMRYPRKVLENAIELYTLRKESLLRYGKQWGLTQMEKKQLMAFAGDHLIRDLFEATGSMLIRGIVCDEMKTPVLLQTEEAYQTSENSVSRRTRFKYFLLRNDVQCAMKLYAYLREVYIRVRR